MTLTRINESTEITVNQARRMYPDKYIFMIIDKQVDFSGNNIGRVIFIMDSKEEIYNVDMAEFAGRTKKIVEGIEILRRPSIGGISIEA